MCSLFVFSYSSKISLTRSRLRGGNSRNYAFEQILMAKILVICAIPNFWQYARGGAMNIKWSILTSSVAEWEWSMTRLRTFVYYSPAKPIHPANKLTV